VKKLQKKLKEQFYETANTLIEGMKDMREDPKKAEALVEISNWADSYVCDMASHLHDSEILTDKEQDKITETFETIRDAADKRHSDMIEKEIEEDLEEEKEAFATDGDKETGDGN
jgi:hypothetical protein